MVRDRKRENVMEKKKKKKKRMTIESVSVHLVENNMLVWQILSKPRSALLLLVSYFNAKPMIDIFSHAAKCSFSFAFYLLVYFLSLSLSHLHACSSFSLCFALAFFHTLLDAFERCAQHSHTPSSAHSTNPNNTCGRFVCAPYTIHTFSSKLTE